MLDHVSSYFLTIGHKVIAQGDSLDRCALWLVLS